MFGLEQDEHSLYQVLVGDVVLNVLGMVLDAERQQLHDD